MGTSGEEPEKTEVIMPFRTREGVILFFYFSFPTNQVESGAVFEFDAENVECNLMYFDGRTRQVSMVATCHTGTLTLEGASMNRGEPFRLSFNTRLWGRRGSR